MLSISYEINALEVKCADTFSTDSLCWIFVKDSSTEIDLIRISNLNQQTKVIIQNCKWKNFPKNLFKIHLNIIEASITCEIENLSQKDFENSKNLTNFKLTNQINLNRIIERNFIHLNKLINLEISFSSISQLDDFAFAGMMNLKFLNLEGNKIKSLYANTFSGARNLEKIQLSWNQISFIEDITFYLPQLTELYLDHNYLGNLSVRSFENLPLLEVLWLSQNNFNEIPDTIYHLIDSLKEFFFNQNDQTNVNIKDFLKFQNLLTLSLEHVRLDYEVDTLNENGIEMRNDLRSKLSTIRLDGTKCTESILDDLSIFPYLEDISLGNNDISHINCIETIKEQFPKLKQLKFLRGNPFDCIWINSALSSLKSDGITAPEHNRCEDI